MERLSREAFVQRFPLVVPAHMVRGIHKDTVVIDRDAQFYGIAERDGVIRSGARVIGHGIVKGDFTVEPGAVVYYGGIAQGTFRVNGAVCLFGRYRSIEIDKDACVSIDPELQIIDDFSS
jgi:lipoprotein-anchoring transpeptidase ErfK/SrfK